MLRIKGNTIPIQTSVSICMYNMFLIQCVFHNLLPNSMRVNVYLFPKKKEEAGLTTCFACRSFTLVSFPVSLSLFTAVVSGMLSSHLTEVCLPLLLTNTLFRKFLSSFFILGTYTKSRQACKHMQACTQTKAEQTLFHFVVTFLLFFSFLLYLCIFYFIKPVYSPFTDSFPATSS